jgi:hypothetical protein
MTVTGVVARQAFIQGAVTGLSEALAARPDMELPTRVRFTQSLTVRCHDAFDGKPLDSINVKIDSSAANNSPQTVSHPFASSKDEWLTQLIYAPGSDSKYSYRYNLYFRDRDSNGASNAADIRYGQAFLDVVPSETYTYRRYEISVAKEFPWKSLARPIRLALSGPEPLEFEPAQLTVSESNTTAAVEAFSPVRTDLNNVVVTATYTPVGGAAPFTLAGSPAGASIFLNPFSRRVVTFRVAAGFDWQDTTRIDIRIVPTNYNTQLCDIGGSFLTCDVPQTRFTYWYSIDRKLRYQAILSRKNGQQTRLQPADTLQPDVFISEPLTPGP